MSGWMGRQFPRFLAAGGLAALANFGSRFAFSEMVSFEWAVVLAFGVGLATGFLLNKFFVFGESANTLHAEMSFYLLVNLFALAQTWLVSVFGARWLTPMLGEGLAQAVAHLAGIMLPVFTSYIGHRYLTFREQRSDGG